MIPYSLIVIQIKCRTLPKYYSEGKTLSTEAEALNLYGYLKFMFDDQTEYVLDVVLTSIADKVAACHESLAYYILMNIVQDVYLYSERSSTFAKWCTIANTFSDLNLKPEFEKELVGKIIVTCNRIPTDFETYLKTTYEFTSAMPFSLAAAVGNVEFGKAVNVSYLQLYHEHGLIKVFNRPIMTVN